MRPSCVRYVAGAVLVAGLAAIVWTAVDGNGSGDDSAAGLAAVGAGDPGDDSGSAIATAPAAESTAAGAAEGADTSESADAATGAASAAGNVGGTDAGESAGAVTGTATAGSAATAAPVTTAAAAATAAVPAEPIEVMGTADTLTGLDGWLNTDATSLEEIRGASRLTVVQFWTFGCRNCKNTLEALGQLYADFRDEGVEIVGVHSPEFSYEAEVDNIIEASAELGVVWPIALDTRKRNFHRWQEGNIGYWPRVYVIDADNQIRFDRTGDGRATYQQLYATVEQLLAEA